MAQKLLHLDHGGAGLEGLGGEGVAEGMDQGALGHLGPHPGPAVEVLDHVLHLVPGEGLPWWWTKRGAPGSAASTEAGEALLAGGQVGGEEGLVGRVHGDGPGPSPLARDGQAAGPGGAGEGTQGEGEGLGQRMPVTKKVATRATSRSG